MSLPAVDWSARWLAPFRQVGEGVEQRVRGGLSVAAALNAELVALPVQLSAGTLRFVPQAALPVGRAYESHIAQTACVPTRDALHDLFNGLVWLTFPRLKRRLNELQAAQLNTRGIGPTRGELRDVLTLFDENAAWLRLPSVLSDALVVRDWTALFVTHRAAWAEARVGVFGHALMEKLNTPRKAITAHAWLIPQTVAVEEVETWLCEALAPARVVGRRHVPLPILGVPGWWPANEEPDFYRDTTVFRPLPDPGRRG